MAGNVSQYPDAYDTPQTKTPGSPGWALNAIVAIEKFIGLRGGLSGTVVDNLPGGAFNKKGKVTAGSTSGSGTLTVNYPEPFPNATDNVQLTNITNSGVDQTLSIDSASPPTPTGFTILMSVSGAPFVGTINFYWEATGS